MLDIVIEWHSLEFVLVNLKKGMEVYHYQGKKKIKLNQSKQLMADERSEVNEAYAGDVIGVFDPGIFSIGDTITTGKKHFAFEGIPTFAPEHFAMIRNKDTMKENNLLKGVEQIAKRRSNPNLY